MLESIIVADIVVTLLPSLDMIRDVNGTSNILSVCIVAQVVAQQRMRRGFEEPLRDVLNSPWSIFLESVPCLIGFNLITNLDCACAVLN